LRAVASSPHAALDLGLGVHLRVDAPSGAVVEHLDLLGEPEVHAAAELPQDHQVDVADHLGLERRLVEQRREGLHRAQVGVEVQVVAEAAQPAALLQRTGERHRVPLRSALGADQHGIGRTGGLDGLLEHPLAVDVPAGTVQQVVLEPEVEAQPIGDPVEDRTGGIDHFRADPVAAHDHDLRHAHTPCVRTLQPTNDGAR
jgi:hypothetical protein